MEEVRASLSKAEGWPACVSKAFLRLETAFSGK